MGICVSVDVVFSFMPRNNLNKLGRSSKSTVKTLEKYSWLLEFVSMYFELLFDY